MDMFPADIFSNVLMHTQLLADDTFETIKNYATKLVRVI